MKPEPTPEELEALQAFKKLYGPHWKSYLRAAWAGACAPMTTASATNTGRLGSIT